MTVRLPPRPSRTPPDPPPAVTPHSWAWYLAGGLGLLALFCAAPSSGAPSVLRTIASLLVSSSAVVAVLIGARLRQRPPARPPWLLFAAAEAAAALGGVLLHGAHHLLDRQGFPGLWDVAFLVQYPLLVAGAAMLGRRRGAADGLTNILDSLTITVAGALVAWIYLVAPRLSTEQALLVRLPALAYALLSLAVLAAGLRLLLNGRPRAVSYYLLLGHLAAVPAAAVLYVPRQLDGTYQVGGPLEIIGMVGALLLGTAALHPSAGDVTAGRPRTGTVLSVPRLLALTAAALVAPVVLTVQSLRGQTDGLVVVAVSSGAMFVLIIFRMAGLVADQHQAAITDGLTGVHTRRHLEGELSASVDRALRHGSRLGLFLIDVDHFKAINDRFGHPSGDDVLVEVARRLRAATRPGDVLGRYGGEEFAVVVTDLREADLAAVGERLRRQVGAEPIRISARTSGEPAPAGQVPGGPAQDDQIVTVTVSVGVAVVPTHAADAAGLVAAADSALYEAKAGGRDRVTISGRPAPPAAEGQLAGRGASRPL
ncbi:GGDEF domain-containing protein [Parafrankia elaeagni]|uniref:GGDEF domain-containing protein n=1 Tax=Parafrankia elaeagni TaxID=222534 RepID=UPI00035FD2C9|nr:GGDEF domain-containing protein [Parafrankia elaeagni]